MIAVGTIDTNVFKKVESRILGNIPESWIKTTLGECFKWGSGGTPKSGNSEYYGGNIPWLVIGDLNDSIINESSQKITEKGLHNSSAKLVDEGTLLLAMYGSIGKLGIAGMKLATNQAIAFAEKNEIETKYLFNFLLYVRLQLNTLGKGATQQNISQTVIKAFPFPLAPLNEQKRIVAKIEELFSELDNGIAALKTAREQLKVYRQAVLKHAFEGKLTAKWREENADKLESPEQLLARIQQEREDRYQQQLEDWKAAVNEWEANGKEGKKPGKPKKTKVLSGRLVDEIIIPNEWSFSIIGELNAEVFDGPFGSNLKSSDYVDRGVRVIRLENIGEMRFIEDKYSFITEEKYQTILKHTVSGGDIIFSSFMTEGIRVIILPESVDKAVNKADCFCVRMFGESYNPRFLVLYLSSRAAYKQIESEIHGIGRPRINTTQLKSFVVPICSIDEQIQILSEIEQQISEIDATESNIDAQIERAKTLRQSILKKAFSGQLVPQDPSDEPASKLLARIQAEKEFVNTQKTSKSNKRHSVSSH